jgi:hypothetical protein
LVEEIKERPRSNCRTFAGTLPRDKRKSHKRTLTREGDCVEEGITGQEEVLRKQEVEVERLARNMEVTIGTAGRWWLKLPCGLVPLLARYGRLLGCTGAG